VGRPGEVDEEVPVALDLEPIAELDLDETEPTAEPAATAAAAPDGEDLDASEPAAEASRWSSWSAWSPWSPSSRPASWRPAVALGVAGALLGGGLVHVVESSRARSETVVRVAIGESGARLLNRRLGTRRVIQLSTLAVNEGSSSLTVRGVRVEGDGAGLTRSFRGEASIYPFILEPGQASNMPLALTSDCEIEGRAVPRVTVDVTAEDGTQRSVEVRIPGLEELWRRSTTTDACGTL
jgi:hypothetical protein